MIINIKTPLDSQICTISYHKVRIYTFTQKLINLDSNIYKFPFSPLNSYTHHSIGSLNMLGTTKSTFFKKISHPKNENEWRKFGNGEIDILPFLGSLMIKNLLSYLRSVENSSPSS
jgi:hypothetical protein